MSIVAKTLFENAVRSHLAERNKWHHSSETSALLSACEEASGISHWILRTAMCESVANTLLNDLHDICKGDLRQNVTAEPCYVRGDCTDKYGNKSEFTRALTVKSPLLDIVKRYLDNLYYQRTEAGSNWSDRQAAFLTFFVKHIDSVEQHYSPECVRQLREYAERNLVETKGGVA